MFSFLRSIIIKSAITDYATGEVTKSFDKPAKNTVCVPKLLSGIFIACCTVFLLFAYFSFAAGELMAACIFLGFSLFGLILLIRCINVKIYYDADGFTVSNFFRVRRHYRYREITSAAVSGEKWLLYVRNKKISVDISMRSGLDFYRYANARYRYFNFGQDIPKTDPAKKSLEL